VGWNGMVAPANLPAPVLEKVHATVVKVFQNPEVTGRMTALAADPITTTPAEVGAYIKAEIGKWAKVVKATGAKAE